MVFPVSVGLINRIWSRVKKALPRQKLSVNADNPPLVSATLDHPTSSLDLEFALESEAAIYAARELFDFSMLEPPSELPCEIQTPPIELIPAVNSLSEDDQVLSALLEAFSNTPLPTCEEAVDMSIYAAFAESFNPSISPQLRNEQPRVAGRTSRRDRANSRAAEWAEEFDLHLEDTRILARLIWRFRLHPKTLRAMHEILSLGYSIDELKTAADIRRIWKRTECLRTIISRHHQDSLLVASPKDSCWPDTERNLRSTYPDSVLITSSWIPGWKQAARWASHLRGIPVQELDSLFYWHFERWLEDSPLWHSSTSFCQFFERSLRSIEPDLKDVIPWEFALQPALFDEYEADQAEKQRTRELYALDLIPDIWKDPFDERVSIDPEFPLLEDCWPQ